MFAVGHLSLGYLSAKATGQVLRQEINLPLVFLLSLIPDADLLVPFLTHRTITHSVFVALAVFLPVFVFYGTRALPYFVALAQHALIGDFLTGGGSQTLWPLTSASYGLGIPIFSGTNILVEWSLFLITGFVMVRAKDLERLLDGRVAHVLLGVPIIAVLLPSFLLYPLPVPSTLLVPHILYLIAFTLSIANFVKTTLIKPFTT